jgi:hypothetical protein
MSTASSHAHAFYRQVAKTGELWTIRDSQGFPTPKSSDGKRAHPFWSSLSRVNKIISSVPAYAGFEPYHLTWDIFRDRWLPGIKKDGLFVGVNWSGKNAKGYDVDSDVVKEAIEFQIRLKAEQGAAANP